MLLIDTRLHAVVADAVASRRRHRVVNRDDRERTNRIALPFHLIHLGDFFFERATGQWHSKRARLEFTRLLSKPGRATVLALVVTLDAIIRLIQSVDDIGARIGQVKTIPMSLVLCAQ